MDGWIGSSSPYRTEYQKEWTLLNGTICKTDTTHLKVVLVMLYYSVSVTFIRGWLEKLQSKLSPLS